MALEQQSVFRANRLSRVRRVRGLRSILCVCRLPGPWRSGSSCHVYASNSQFELLGGVEREMAVEALEHEGEELRPTGKTEIARQRSQVIKEGLTAH